MRRNPTSCLNDCSLTRLAWQHREGCDQLGLPSRVEFLRKKISTLIFFCVIRYEVLDRFVAIFLLFIPSSILALSRG